MTRRVLPVVSSDSSVAADTALHAPDQPDGAGQLLVRGRAADPARPARVSMDVRPGARCHRELRLFQYLRPWPGPNSNTFLAHIARQVPDLAIQLPSNAVGKDFLPGGRVVALAPSGSGFQVL